MNRLGCGSIAFFAVLVLALTLTLTACGGDADVYSNVSDYLPPIEPPLDLAITDCLPQGQVGAVMGKPMTASDPYEDGTWVIYTSDDGTASVSVSMENQTEAIYDAMVADLVGGEAVTDLGARAFWYAERGEMIDYCDGYAIAVSVTEPSVENTYGLCHTIVKTLRNNLLAK